MKQSVEEIYSTLQAYSSNVYYNFIDDDVDGSGLSIVYEVNTESSNNTLDQKNYSNLVALRVKLLHNSPGELLTKGQEVINTFLSSTYTNLKDVTFINDVPIFYDSDLKVNQYTMNFRFYKKNK
jgi:hypothetical protein